MDFYYDSESDDSEIISGVAFGIVKQNEDEEHSGMVQAEFFLGQSGENLSGWIPVAVPYAGNGYGYYALPEVGDLVVIAFQEGNRNCPVVLGSLWSKTNVFPQEAGTEQNGAKLFYTKGGCKLLFQDTAEEQCIVLTTPKGLCLTLHDKEEKITCLDQAGENGIEINSKEGTLTIKAKKKIVLDAGGAAAMTLDGEGTSVQMNSNNVEIQAKQSLTAKGSNVQVTGSTVAVKGDNTVQVEGGTLAQVKAQAVQING